MPPPAVNVELLPEQIVLGLATAVTVGLLFAFTEIVVVELQPAAFVPVTVYITVPVGVITTLVPVKAPGFHVYDVAPAPVNVAVLPTQRRVGLEDAVIVGDELTVKDIVFVLVHEPLVPVTVYIVVVVGVTATEAPVKAPGFQV